MKVGRPASGCKRCGSPGRIGHELSWLGYCRVCGPAIAKEAQLQISAHQGPYFQKWRMATAASVGALLPEQLAAILDERAENP